MLYIDVELGSKAAHYNDIYHNITYYAIVILYYVIISS